MSMKQRSTRGLPLWRAADLLNQLGRPALSTRVFQQSGSLLLRKLPVKGTSGDIFDLHFRPIRLKMFALAVP
jgi:hypothetical protein